MCMCVLYCFNDFVGVWIECDGYDDVVFVVKVQWVSQCVVVIGVEDDFVVEKLGCIIECMCQCQVIVCVQQKDLVCFIESGSYGVE